MFIHLSFIANGNVHTKSANFGSIFSHFHTNHHHFEIKQLFWVFARSVFVCCLFCFWLRFVLIYENQGSGAQTPFYGKNFVDYIVNPWGMIGAGPSGHPLWKYLDLPFDMFSLWHHEGSWSKCIDVWKSTF